MLEFAREAVRYRESVRMRESEGAQVAAFYLMSGIDLCDALSTSGPDRSAVLVRVERLLERERLKGVRRHWSYDLNRHIALKQARDRLREGMSLP